jgi:hypothetical protein
MRPRVCNKDARADADANTGSNTHTGPPGDSCATTYADAPDGAAGAASRRNHATTDSRAAARSTS